MEQIYLDHAATTPTDPEVIKAMELYFFNKFGNPSSSHVFGREAKKALEESRETLAKFLGAQPNEIIFNSGATESNNHAVMGVARALKDKGNHIILSKVEHHSVHEPAEYLRKEGFDITYLNVDDKGMIDPHDVKEALTDQTILICVIQANNEIGTIQPIAQIGEVAKESGVTFLVDAVQAVGHIPVNVNELNADLLSLSAHKLYGPKGIGALYIGKGTKIVPFLIGGDQERSQRASTQNVAGAVGLAKAIELCASNMEEEISLQTRLRDKLINEILKCIEGVHVNGHLEHRLPNNAHFSFEKVQGESLLMSLDMAGMAASMGSACTSGALEPSRILRAIGLSDELAYGSLRITIGRWTTEEHVDHLLGQLPDMVKKLRMENAGTNC